MIVYVQQLNGINQTGGSSSSSTYLRSRVSNYQPKPAGTKTTLVHGCTHRRERKQAVQSTITWHQIYVARCIFYPRGTERHVRLTWVATFVRCRIATTVQLFVVTDTVFCCILSTQIHGKIFQACVFADRSGCWAELALPTHKTPAFCSQLLLVYCLQRRQNEHLLAMPSATPPATQSTHSAYPPLRTYMHHGCVICLADEI